MIRVLVLALSALWASGAAALDIREVTSPGGIHAWLVEEHQIPFTALELRFKGGTSLDRPGKRGAVELMTGLLEEGAGEMDAQNFAAAREALAARFGFDSDSDGLSISARMLTENRDQAAALLKQALVAPRFDADAIDRVKGQIYAIIQSRTTDPGYIAAGDFDAMAYGGHPYGTPDIGSRESVGALTRDDLLAAKAATMARDRLYVAAVGDINADELGTLLDTLLDELPATGAPMPADVAPTIAPGVTVHDFASPQSLVLFGQVGIKRDDPDFFAAYVLDHIVGGQGFASRLMDELREKRGLTYGVSTWLATRDHSEVWQGAFNSANEKVAEAISVVKEQWARIAGGDLSEAELVAAKTYLTGSYPLRFDGNETIAGILVGMQSQGYPISYVTERNAHIEAVTLADLRRVAGRLMVPGGLRFIVVGQPAGVASDK
ncbi:MAG: insulinase family protein [Defluviimonas sp.]|uniref:M16 family metallopeptidase n=1 Tax=Albidovulum sp. TaxID=1872424 RepID=UPI002A31C0F1|nr:insulinase family protein [Defluviimonas sp.]